MGLLDIFNHLLNFALPALVMACLLVGAARMIWRHPPKVGVWWKQIVVNCAVGLVVLLAGLIVFGYDGKMLTYGALVLAMASSQWWQSGLWRR